MENVIQFLDLDINSWTKTLPNEPKTDEKINILRTTPTPSNEAPYH